jgi:hypothetical protein
MVYTIPPLATITRKWWQEMPIIYTTPSPSPAQAGRKASPTRTRPKSRSTPGFAADHVDLDLAVAGEAIFERVFLSWLIRLSIFRSKMVSYPFVISIIIATTSQEYPAQKHASALNPKAWFLAYWNRV